MDTKELYREILNEHNLNPLHKTNDAQKKEDTISLEGINPSCGDNITLNLKVENGKITDGFFTGSGCAVSQASCDMMLDLVIGKSATEAMTLESNFMKMIKGEATKAELETLDEAAALEDISKMPARVRCAVLGWRTLKEIITQKLPRSFETKAEASENCSVCTNPNCQRK